MILNYLLETTPNVSWWPSQTYWSRGRLMDHDSVIPLMDSLSQEFHEDLSKYPGLILGSLFVIMYHTQS